MEETDINGKVAFWDQVGATAAREINERHGDSPLMNTPHARRRCHLTDWDWGDLIDKPDKVRTVKDFTSPYVQNAGFAMGRAIDTVLIRSFFGVAFTDETGSTSTSFPSSQQIAVNFGGTNVGLTVEKLREARRLLKAANVDMTDPMHIAMTAKQKDNLLGTTQVTSSDYNTVKALVQGDVDTFMGFKFLETELLEVDGSSHRRLPCWSKTGMKLGIGADIVARITERADKRFSTYVYFCMTIGATRMEEVKVVEIKCLE
jgi:hypothetical protein